MGIGVFFNVKNISAKKQTKKKRTWIQKKNEDLKWKEGLSKTQVERKKSAFSIRPHECGLFL